MLSRKAFASEVSMETFLGMTEMRSHQELKQRGELVEYDESMGAALFISHQWRAPARKGTVLFGEL